MTEVAFWDNFFSHVDVVKVRILCTHGVVFLGLNATQVKVPRYGSGLDFTSAAYCEHVHRRSWRVAAGRVRWAWSTRNRCVL